MTPLIVPYDPTLPHFTAEQHARTDQLMLDTYHVSVKQLMEVAGLRLAEFIVQSLSTETRKGNNGADGLVAARYLSVWGYNVNTITVTPPSLLTALCLEQFKSTQAFNISHVAFSPSLPLPSKNDVIVDGLLGCGLNGTPKAPYNNAIHWINQSQAHIISIDLPSGMNATTGDCYQPTVRSGSTLTFSAPKTGFLKSPLHNLFVADIGIPNTLYLS